MMRVKVVGPLSGALAFLVAIVVSGCGGDGEVIASRSAVPEISCTSTATASSSEGSQSASSLKDLARSFNDGSLTLAGEVIPGASGVAYRDVHSSASAVAAVRDQRGPDVLVVEHVDGSGGAPDSGRLEYQGRGELVHPHATSHGSVVVDRGDAGDVLVHLGSDLVEQQVIEPPPHALAISYPTWLGPSSVVAVIDEPAGFDPTIEPARSDVDGDPTHATTDQSNLWTLDLNTKEWDRLTTFSNRDDSWISVQTPTHDGETVSFVVVRGRGSGSSDDLSFELWSIEDGRSEKIAKLDGETYLAGVAEDGQLIGSTWDPALNTWSTGPLVDGAVFAEVCGAARVTTLDVDPDQDLVGESNG